MQRCARATWALAVIAVAGGAWAGEREVEPRLRLELDLVDGSHIIGAPRIDAVPVQTSYAKMDIPLKEILAITMGSDHETGAVELRNGDKLKGVIDLKPVELETVFGKVAVGTEHLRGLRVALGGGVVPEALRQGLVACYSFDRDEGGKASDGSGTRRDGEVHGATWAAQGKVGGAFDFDGKDDFVELGPSRLYRAAGRLSACAWLQPRGQVAILLSNYHGGSAYNGQFYFGYWGDGPAAAPNGALDLIFGQSAGAFLRYRTRAVELPAGAWHHVAFSYDESRGAGRKVLFYVDGEEVPVSVIQSEGNGSPVLDIDENLRIMAHRDTPTGTLADGLVDEVMLFDRALTDEEIRRIYDAQK